MRKVFTLVLVFAFLFSLKAQLKISPFTDLGLKVDSVTIAYPTDGIQFRKEFYLPIPFERDDQTILGSFLLNDGFTGKMRIVPSGDYEVLDSVMNINGVYQFKIRLKDITRNDFQKIRFAYSKDTLQKVFDIPLLPHTKTSVQVVGEANELFIGEEKVFELASNQVFNVKPQPQWNNLNGMNYRLVEQNGILRLHLVANELGRKLFNTKLETYKPFINPDGELIFNQPEISLNLVVKGSRLQFLSPDKQDFTMDEEARRTGIEVQLDDSRYFQIGKTYRVEDQEDAGGPLVAELFTKNRLTNGKVLAILRPYNYHRNTDGYLYIKDGDDPRFITNFNITPKTQIEKISILRDGKNWTGNTTVHPGEVINVKIEGEALHKANFHFEDVQVLSNDSLIRNEDVAEYKIKVPIDVSKKQLNIYNHGKATGQMLKVSEYQDAREFDFVNLDYGDRKIRFASIRAPKLYYNTVKDVNISFSNFKLDSDEKLDGKQYLDLEVEVTDKNNKLIELKEIKNIVVCPSDNSPRFQYYDKDDCTLNDINLNNYLRSKTYELDEWSRIKLSLSHDDGKHDNGFEKEVEVVLARRYKFDIDVSFPAGLITIYKTDVEEEVTDENGNTETITRRETEYGNLWGISMAMIGQFSFYHPDKVAKLRPYKIGAGFIALNAFNFSSNNDNQDIAFVVLGSLYPTSKDRKLSFPLYVGFGYKLLDRSPMFLIGPGIRVNL